MIIKFLTLNLTLLEFFIWKSFTLNSYVFLTFLPPAADASNVLFHRDSSRKRRKSRRKNRKKFWRRQNWRNPTRVTWKFSINFIIKKL